MVARLTGGNFKYTRRVKPGDPNEYNAPFREATAELSWSGDEDDDPAYTVELMNEVRLATVDQVNKMLTLKSEQKAPIEQSVQPKTIFNPIYDAAATEMMALETPKRGPGRPRKDTQLQTEISIEAETDKAVEELDLEISPSVVEISTKDLLEAITRKNTERMARPEGGDRSVQPLRDLIGKYVQLPKTARDIPIELRHKFLEELKEL